MGYLSTGEMGNTGEGDTGGTGVTGGTGGTEGANGPLGTEGTTCTEGNRGREATHNYGRLHHVRFHTASPRLKAVCMSGGARQCRRGVLALIQCTGCTGRTADRRGTGDTGECTPRGTALGVT